MCNFKHFPPFYRAAQIDDGNYLKIFLQCWTAETSSFVKCIVKFSIVFYCIF